MPELELRHLRVVCTVVDAGSLSRAAAQLGVSQPALTAQLQRIERQLGGRLFERTREGMTPTELGDFLVSGARVVLADMSHLMAGVAERVKPRAAGGPVLVAGSAGPLAPMFAARLRSALDLPQVGTEVESGSRTLFRLVQSGRVDFAIVEAWRDLPYRIPEAVRARLLVVEPSFVALPEEHPLGALDVVPLARLAEEDWAVVPPTESGEQLALQRACAQAGFTPRIRHHTTESSSARELVRSGVVTLAHPASRQGDGVTVRPLAGSPLLVDLLLTWRPDGPMAGHADVAFRCAAEAYLGLVGRSESFQRWWDEHPEAHAELDAAVRGPS
ncbi:MAG: LysR family transcriptional regulator [Actinobacteria bacterium]|nr:LysR family transcriptional regulator [Actinomycetota bacterium]MBI3686378.1 LysR family transcriptional regulator [Actinomycetota bacterium]